MSDGLGGSHGYINIASLTAVNGSERRERGAVSINKPKNVFLIKGNIEFPQQGHVFILERLLVVVCFLILNVANDRVQLRMPVRECSITFLPIEASVDEFAIIYEVR